MVRDWLFGIAAALAVASVVRIFFLLLFRRPMPARVINVGLDEGERLHERDMHMIARFSDAPTTDGFHYRPTSVRVAYDIGGSEYRTEVTLIRHTGDLPDMNPVIWYDPRDPERATGLGTGLAVLAIFIADGIAVLGWHCPF